MKIYAFKFLTSTVIILQVFHLKFQNFSEGFGKHGFRRVRFAAGLRRHDQGGLERLQQQFRRTVSKAKLA